MITHTCWVMLVANWGDSNSLINTPWSSASTPLLNGIAATEVQFFFSWRIWQMSNSRIGQTVAVWIILIALIQLGAATVMTVEYVNIARNTARLATLSVIADTWLVASFVCDAISALSMVFVLRRARNQTAYKGTESLLNRLIVINVETGAITAGFALITLVLFKVFPNDYYFLTTEFILGKMHDLSFSSSKFPTDGLSIRYSNVLLATLNGRQRSRNTVQTVMSNFGTINFGNEMNTFSPARTADAGSSGVVISTAVATDRVRFNLGA
ncbi:hypothetical protein B0H19DRAFT_1375147 [Mycena capillaripes]|nr:hypothetical protein B0H19DRAFT_1375147 [Mycena capillaripes]